MCGEKRGKSFILKEKIERTKESEETRDRGRYRAYSYLSCSIVILYIVFVHNNRQLRAPEEQDNIITSSTKLFFECVFLANNIPSSI